MIPGVWTAWLIGLPPWIVAGIIGLVAWIVVALVARTLHRSFGKIAEKTRTELDDELYDRLRLPVRWIGPAIGVHAAGVVLDYHGLIGAVEIIEGLLVTYAAVAGFEILVIEQWVQRRQGFVVPPLVRQVIIGVIYGCVVIGVAGEVFGIDITPLLATTSVTTIVLGLALQTPLSNLFSGLLLHIEHHPNVGEWVLVEGREGRIEEIGWRSTRLRLFSDDLLIVPNLSILNAQLVNFSSGPVPYRLLPFPVPLDVSPSQVEAMVADVLASVDGVAHDRPHKVWLTAIEDHCQRYVIKFAVVEFRRHDDAESDVLKGIWRCFQAEGIPFPTPHQAIRVVQGEPPPAFAGLDPARRAERVGNR